MCENLAANTSTGLIERLNKSLGDYSVQVPPIWQTMPLSNPFHVSACWLTGDNYTPPPHPFIRVILPSIISQTFVNNIPSNNQ